MDKQKITDFFNAHAASWDAEMIRHDDVIAAILDGAGVSPGEDVLDVACGTGVLVPDYLARGVGSVTAIDISPEMCAICAEKFPEVTVICGDAEEYDFGRQFDRIMLYNCYPHFPDREGIIRSLSSLLKPGGTLTVAHGMSRAAIDAHHAGAAKDVSLGLPEANFLADIFSKYLEVTLITDNNRMYQVTGRRAAE